MSVDRVDNRWKRLKTYAPKVWNGTLSVLHLQPKTNIEITS